MIAGALKDTDSCRLLLEQTAGHKGLLGRDFDQTAELIDGAGGGKRLGLCLDSCHLFVQGYDITDEDHLAAVLDEADAKVGIDRLGAVHVNDAAAPLGSCRDRHANIGKGEMGRKGLAAFLSEPRFEGLPATLETPGPDKKGSDKKEVTLAKRLRREGLKRRRSLTPVAWRPWKASSRQDAIAWFLCGRSAPKERATALAPAGGSSGTRRARPAVAQASAPDPPQTPHRAGDKGRPPGRPSLSRRKFVYLTWTPEIAREMTRRWISEVPSKIV